MLGEFPFFISFDFSFSWSSLSLSLSRYGTQVCCHESRAMWVMIWYDSTIPLTLPYHVSLLSLTLSSLPNVFFFYSSIFIIIIVIFSSYFQRTKETTTRWKSRIIPRPISPGRFSHVPSNLFPSRLHLHYPSLFLIITLHVAHFSFWFFLYSIQCVFLFILIFHGSAVELSYQPIVIASIIYTCLLIVCFI